MTEAFSGAEPPKQLTPERRRQILAGARTVFIAEGFEGASMAQIAAASRVSKGTLYNYFSGKEVLFAAFVRDQTENFMETVFGDMPGEDVQAGLTRIGSLMLRAMISPRSLAMFRVIMMQAPKFPGLAQDFFRAGPAVMVTRTAAWLRQQHEAGLLRVPDADFAAEQFFSLSQARLLMRARIDPDYTASEADIDHVVRAAVRVFLAAYGA